MIVVLTGLAGAGKTELLRRLAARGEAVLDLEALAGHRGSAFGNLGGTPQPRHRAFQDAVRRVLAAAPPDRPLWTEDEGDYIGSVGLPPELVAAMRVAPCVEVATALDARVARILDGYGTQPIAAWRGAVARVAPRLGAGRAGRVRAALAAQDLEAAVRVLLDYYDTGYLHRSRTLGRRVLATVTPTDVDAALAAAARA
jgi:tRNA 2-selenouridine synthase